MAVRMTSPEGKNIAGWYVHIEVTTTFRAHPLNSFFQATKKKQAREAAQKMIEQAKAAGADHAEVTIFALYRDERTGRFLPGSGIVNQKLTYRNR